MTRPALILCLLLPFLLAADNVTAGKRYYLTVSGVRYTVETTHKLSDGTWQVQYINVQPTTQRRVTTAVLQEITPVPPPACDNDGVCDVGETPTNCPNDCTVTTQPVPIPADRPPYIPLPAWDPATIPAGAILKTTYNGIIGDVGTATAPYFYKLGTATAPFTGKIEVGPSARYIILQAIQDRGLQSSAFDIAKGAQFIVVRDSDIQDGQTALSTAGTDVVIRNCRIHDNGNWQPTAPGDRDYLGIAGYGGHRLHVYGCEIFHCESDGIQINNGGFRASATAPLNDAGIRQTFIYNNYIHHNKQSAVGTKGCYDMVIARNKFEGHHVSTSGSGPGQINQYGGVGIWNVENECIDNDRSFGVVGVSYGPETSGYDLIYYRNKTTSLTGPYRFDVPGSDPAYAFGIDVAAWGNGMALVENSFIRGIGYDGGRKCGGLNNHFVESLVWNETTPLTAAEWTALRNQYQATFGKELP